METKNTVQYKCPCCGGFIAYDSAVGKMKCPYCDTEFELETLKSYDESLKNDMSDDMNWISDDEKERFDGDGDGMCIYVCQSCGGEIIADDTTAATSCPFCGNPTIFKSQLSGELKPDYIIPFKLDKNTAKEALKKHLTGKKLLPKLFKSENHIDEIKGVYVPFWLFDTDADAEARYHATRTRFWSDKDYDYTETSHYSVLRSGSMSFDHIPVDGSKKMPDDLMESLEPFDFSEAVDFSMAYLSGYLADKSDVSSDECNERANERVKRSSDKLRGRYHADLNGIGIYILEHGVESIVQALIEDGAVYGRVSIGVTVGPVSKDIAQYYDIPQGLYVSAVTEGSDAEAKGIERGDIITKVNGEDAFENSDVSDAKEGLKAGDTLTFTVWRDGRTLDITVKLMDPADMGK